MNDEQYPTDRPLPFVVLRRLDRVCVEFEAVWKRGATPRIEEYLGGAQGPERAWLSSQLLLLELDYRERSGEIPSASDYHARFPHDSAMVEAAFDKGGHASDEEETGDWKASSCASVETSLSKIPVPPTIGRYKVISALRAGGQAYVYRAVHPTLDKELVVKLARQPLCVGRDDVDRLVAEGKVLAELDHPHMVRVYDLGFHEDRPYLVMEYVPGRNLRQYAEGQRPAPQEAALLVAKVARALHVAHAHGVVHQDIKPENILIDEAGEPRIIDFGLARLQQAWEANPTKPGRISGTARYMPPEQARGETDRVDQRSDVFALGAVLYWLLTEHAPFAGKDFDDSLDRASRCDFDRRALRRSGISRRLETICLKAMSAEQTDRYATAEALAYTLERFARRSTRPLRMTAAAASVFLVVALGICWRPSLPGLSNLRPSAPDNELRPLVPDNERTPQVTELRLQVTVRRGDTVLDLANAVPLYSGDGQPGNEPEGDDLQILCELPTGFQASVFWFDTEAQLYALPAKQMNQEGKPILVWPEVDRGNVLAGSPGTEVIFVCASRSGPPRLEEIRPLLAHADPWPEMRRSAVLEFDRQTLSMRRIRGPGTEERDRPDGPVIRRAEELQRALAERVELFSAVAFPHVRPLAPAANIRHRHALLVGCTKYTNLDPALHLCGPANDVTLMQNTLVDRFAFSTQNVVTLSEAEGEDGRRPTRANIEREFSHLAQTARPDDFVVIYLSGHGTQQPDDDPDNLEDPEPDGLDEVFCPADVSSILAKDEIAIPGAISDDTLRAWLSRILEKDAWVWVIVDSCHSGTITRGGDEVARRIPASVLVPEAAIEKARRHAVKATTDRGSSPLADALNLVSGKQRLVVMYASQADEPTVEKSLPPEGEQQNRHGLFSFTLVEALTNAVAPLTYDELIQRVQSRYQHWGRADPNPWIEGAMKHHPVLGLHEWPGLSQAQKQSK